MAVMDRCDLCGSAVEEIYSLCDGCDNAVLDWIESNDLYRMKDGSVYRFSERSNRYVKVK